MTATKIVHLSSVHRATDIRILHKECRSLAQAGFQVTLVARADDDDSIHGVCIRAIRSESKSRFIRMTRTLFEVFRKAVESKGDLYHFHDSELIPVGLVLKLLGKRVVYDVHENLPKDIRTKPWIPAVLRRPIASAVDIVERSSARVFDGVVAATPGIAARFVDSYAVTVQNFPLLSEFEGEGDLPYCARAMTVAYVGALTEIRGVKEMVESIELVNAEKQASLCLAGAYTPESLLDEVRQLRGWKYVEDLGWLSRPQVASLLGTTRVGLLVVHPVPNLLDSYPNKMFEYMAAGLPLVTSDFPFWKQFVTDVGCGLMVDPCDPRAIADAIVWLLDHPDEAQAMGQRGREAVLAHFTWETEAEKLLGFYHKTVLR